MDPASEQVLQVMSQAIHYPLEFKVVPSQDRQSVLVASLQVKQLASQALQST